MKERGELLNTQVLYTILGGRIVYEGNRKIGLLKHLLKMAGLRESDLN